MFYVGYHSFIIFSFYNNTVNSTGARGVVVVKALRYKPAGRGSIPDGVIGIFH
jgi:hypothetical protein